MHTHACTKALTHPHAFRGCYQLPDDIDSPRADLRVAAHDGHAGCKRAIDAEDHTLHAPWQHSQVGLCTRLIPPWDRKRERLHNKRETAFACYSPPPLYILPYLARSSHTDTSTGIGLNSIFSPFSTYISILFDSTVFCNGRPHGRLLDHHFNWIDTQAEFLALGYGICDSAAAVGHLCVKMHPATRLGLCHQQDVHLTGTRGIKT